MLAGFEKSKKEVVGVVHVGEATLAKRVKEFALTSSGDLTLQEFEDQVRQLEGQQKKTLQLTSIGAPAPSDTRIGCQHMGAPYPNAYFHILLRSL
jgi:transcription factor IIIB subunit 2